LTPYHYYAIIRVMNTRRWIFAAFALFIALSWACKNEAEETPPPATVDAETDDADSGDNGKTDTGDDEKTDPGYTDLPEEQPDLKTALSTLFDKAAADTLVFADVEDFFTKCHLNTDMREYYDFDEAWVEIKEEDFPAFKANILLLLAEEKTCAYTFQNYGKNAVSDAAQEAYRAISGAALLTSHKESAHALPDGVFTSGTIPAAGQSVWYKFEAAEGCSYETLWADSAANSALFSPEPTCNVNVSAYTGDGSLVFLYFEAGNQPFLCRPGAAKPETISGITGTVYLRVSAKASGATGTFAIKVTNVTEE